MPSATVSTVASASIATTPASIRSVTRADHHQPEELAVPALVDRLDPSGRLVLHHGAGVRDPGEHPDLDVVAVLLAGLLLREPDAGDLGVRVDRAGTARLSTTAS